MRWEHKETLGLAFTSALTDKCPCKCSFGSWDHWKRERWWCGWKKKSEEVQELWKWWTKRYNLLRKSKMYKSIYLHAFSFQKSTLFATLSWFLFPKNLSQHSINCFSDQESHCVDPARFPALTLSAQLPQIWPLHTSAPDMRSSLTSSNVLHISPLWAFFSRTLAQGFLFCYLTPYACFQVSLKIIFLILESRIFPCLLLSQSFSIIVPIYAGRLMPVCPWW